MGLLSTGEKSRLVRYSTLQDPPHQRHGERNRRPYDAQVLRKLRCSRRSDQEGRRRRVSSVGSGRRIDRLRYTISLERTRIREEVSDQALERNQVHSRQHNRNLISEKTQ